MGVNVMTQNMGVFELNVHPRINSDGDVVSLPPDKWMVFVAQTVEQAIANALNKRIEREGNGANLPAIAYQTIKKTSNGGRIIKRFRVEEIHED